MARAVCKTDSLPNQLPRFASLSKQLSHPDGYVGLIQRVCVTSNPVRQVTSVAIPASFSCAFLTMTHSCFISRRRLVTSSSARAAGLALKHLTAVAETRPSRQRRYIRHTEEENKALLLRRQSDRSLLRGNTLRRELVLFFSFFSADMRSGERWLSEGAAWKRQTMRSGGESRYPRQHMFESER